FDLRMSSNILEDDNDNDENGPHESRPISAIAPSVRIQEESQVEVTASPAFQCLEELFDAGKVTGTRMAELKSKYTAIHDMLKLTRDSESKLLEDAKNFTNELEKQRLALEKADHFPENIDSEVGKLRQELLKRHNDIQQIEEREYELHYKIDSLEEEMRLLQREYERVPKKDEVEAKKREIENQTEQQRKENAQRVLELKNLREDLETKDRQNGMDAKELEGKMEEVEGLKNSLVQIHGVPTQLSKEIDKIHKQKVDTSKRQVELSSQFMNLESEMKVIDGKRLKIEKEKGEVEEELDMQRSILEGKEREYDKLMKDFDFEKEREAVLLGDRFEYFVYLSLRHTQLEKKTGHDTLTRKQREKDRDLRQLKKLEQQLKVATDALAHQQTIYDKVKDQVSYDGTQYDKRKQLQAEVDEAKRKHGQQQRYHRAEQELKSKQLTINDHKKKSIEVQIRLQENLQKARLKKMNSLVLRDSLRNEQSKATALEAELVEKREQLKMQIGKLNTLNNQAEEGMVQLRKRYETAVQHRNDRGVQLVEREEEVCIFYEKFNIQETMIRNGDVAIQTMEEEIRFLRMQNAEEQRQINLGRKNRPNLKHLNDELVTLQIQLSQCQDRMKDLENELEDPDQPGRVRLLQGKDPSPTELRCMIENLEIRLAEKEEQLLERDLIFEQDSRVTERVQNKVDIGKSDSLTLAKKVNGFQSRIKDVTRKMMSLVSELAMKQAEAMQLQRKCKTLNVDLQQCYTRMEQGEPPSDGIQLEWEKLFATETRKRHDDAERAMIDQEDQQYQLVGGVATTAEPRPNAYIPEDDSGLPIPRPYGSLAPFKPTEPGSSMRHIRKPVLRPIEI
uniref:Coiled-coil domain containing 146 n=1 Tax=Ciona savignyi TaxID=51511 RepID=H2Z879_CIOSA